MNDHDALLNAVLENPDDDLPRLVFADWCEENGQEQRAAMIRQQVEREALAATMDDDAEAFDRTLGVVNFFNHPEWRRYVQLQHKIKEHNDSGLFKSLLEEITPGQVWFARAVDQVKLLILDSPIPSIHHGAIAFKRGFVEEIRGTVDDLNEIKQAIFRTNPVKRIISWHTPGSSEVTETIYRRNGCWELEYKMSPEASSFPGHSIRFPDRESVVKWFNAIQDYNYVEHFQERTNETYSRYGLSPSFARLPAPIR